MMKIPVCRVGRIRGLRPQSGLSDVLLFFPGGWLAFPVEAAQRPPGLRWLPCPVNCNGSAGSGNKSAERGDQGYLCELGRMVFQQMGKKTMQEDLKMAT